VLIRKVELVIITRVGVRVGLTVAVDAVLVGFVAVLLITIGTVLV